MAKLLRKIAPANRRFRRLAAGMLGLGAIALCVAARYWWSADEASAQAPTRRVSAGQATSRATDRPAAPQAQQPRVVAVVNAEEITREQLADDCLRRYGADVLESLINKQLVVGYCRRHDVRITRQEVDAEVDRIAQRFRVPREQWLGMLEKERGVSPEKYAADIIWPTLALRKAAERLLEISTEELRAAYETHYGPAVQARIIVCESREKAEEVHGLVAAKPEEFARLAREHSVDPASAPYGGQILPIRMHLGDERIEKAAFALKDGEISQPLAVEEQFVILKCERRLPSRMAEFPLQRVKGELTESVRESKERIVAADVSEKLRKSARIVRVFGDDAESKRYPGVAAVVNGQQIPLSRLAEECVDRHGVEVLEGTIGRRILEQACRKHEIVVSQKDIDTEVARAAESMGVVDSEGRADVEAWLATVQREQGLSWERYVHENVWPTAALKKYVALSGEGAVVTEEDLRRGYEANWGPMVKCRAIVLNNARTAQEVWDLAKENPNALYFGQLAYKYSIDANTKYLNGEIPPLRRHGGKPMLEKEAFALKPNQVSGIIQVGEQFVILFCERYIEPESRPPFEEVRDEIHKDLYEKKLRLAMADAYTALIDAARIENFLANTRQAPKTGEPAAPGTSAGALRQGVAPRR